MDRIITDLIIFSGSFTPSLSLSSSVWHPPPDCRKMPKSAFKLKAIHLHIFDYSINLPPVFFFLLLFFSLTHQSAATARGGIVYCRWWCCWWWDGCGYVWILYMCGAKMESKKRKKVKMRIELERDLCSRGRVRRRRKVPSLAVESGDRGLLICELHVITSI